MKPEDKAAFERKYGKAAHKSIFELSTYELRMDAWQAALAHRDAQPAVAVNEQMLEALNDFSNYVHTEQSSTDGYVQYSNTQINRLAFKARSAIAAAEAAKGGV